jgi:shikimate kinase
MGSGKTTIGQKLAKRISRRFIDTDVEIEKTQLHNIAEIFEQSGEAEFRRIEKELILKIASEQLPAVIALGGGSLMDADSLDAVKSSGLLIYLECSSDVLRERIQNSTRPLLKTESIESLMEKRLKGYESADLTLSTQSNTIEDVVKNICHELGFGMKNYINAR